MTPADEWDTTPDPDRLLALLRPPVNVRRARMAAVGYMWHHVERLGTPSCHEFAQTLERHAFGEESEATLDDMYRALTYFPGTRSGEEFIRECVIRDWWTPETSGTRHDVIVYQLKLLDRAEAVARASRAVGPAPSTVSPGHSWHAAFRDAFLDFLSAKAAIFRCVFPNPHRPLPDLSAWRTSTAVALAEQAYQSRDFAMLPVLADALQDAGCDDEHVLAHLRGPGPHARGCWAVDLVLGRGCR